MALYEKCMVFQSESNGTSFISFREHKKTGVESQNFDSKLFLTSKYPTHAQNFDIFPIVETS